MRIPAYSSSQSGNALFLILIAVALFAALSYAVTHSGRGSGTISREQDVLYAAQIASAVSALKSSTTRFILSGTSPGNIACKPVLDTYDCGVGSANGAVDLCTTGPTCLFAPDGGAAAVPQLPKQAYDMTKVTTVFSGRYAHAFTGPTSYQGFLIDGFNGGGEDTAIEGIGTPAKDTIVGLLGISDSICLALNRGLGITGIPVEADGDWNPLSATAGKEAACFKDGPLDINTYYQVLNAN